MKNTKILIVDDDFDIIEPLAMLFEQEGYDVAAITKGDQTFEKITSFKPDLLLLDILMSGSDGRTICRTLKSKAETKLLPIIMMSAHPAAKADSSTCGADDFIAKPFDIDDLLTLIRNYIN